MKCSKCGEVGTPGMTLNQRTAFGGVIYWACTPCEVRIVGEVFNLPNVLELQELDVRKSVQDQMHLHWFHHHYSTQGRAAALLELDPEKIVRQKVETYKKIADKQRSLATWFIENHLPFFGQEMGEFE